MVKILQAAKKYAYIVAGDICNDGGGYTERFNVELNFSPHDLEKALSKIKLFEEFKSCIFEDLYCEVRKISKLTRDELYEFLEQEVNCDIIVRSRDPDYDEDNNLCSFKDLTYVEVLDLIAKILNPNFYVKNSYSINEAMPIETNFGAAFIGC